MGVMSIQCLWEEIRVRISSLEILIQLEMSLKDLVVCSFKELAQDYNDSINDSEILEVAMGAFFFY